jgi:transposase-like protein
MTEVITSVQRRRRWSAEEKQRIVAAAIEPGDPSFSASPQQSPFIRAVMPCRHVAPRHVAETDCMPGHIGFEL